MLRRWIKRNDRLLPTPSSEDQHLTSTYTQCYLPTMSYYTHKPIKRDLSADMKFGLCRRVPDHGCRPMSTGCRWLGGSGSTLTRRRRVGRASNYGIGRCGSRPSKGINDGGSGSTPTDFGRRGSRPSNGNEIDAAAVVRLIHRLTTVATVAESLGRIKILHPLASDSILLAGRECQRFSGYPRYLTNTFCHKRG